MLSAKVHTMSEAQQNYREKEERKKKKKNKKGGRTYTRQYVEFFVDLFVDCSGHNLQLGECVCNRVYACHTKAQDFVPLPVQTW